MHGKKFGVTFLLLACLMFLISEAAIAKPVDPTVYFTPGEATGDSWNYSWDAGYAGEFTVKLYAEPLPNGVEHRNYYINDDQDDIFLKCETDRKSIFIIEAARGECIAYSEEVCIDGIEGEGFDIWIGTEITSSLLKSDRVIPEGGIPSSDAEGNPVTYAWHLSFHRGTLQSHDGTLFSNWLRLVVLDLDHGPNNQSHIAAGLDERKVPYRVVSFSDYVEDVGLVLHQEYKYSSSTALGRRYRLDLTP
jgi:hypothetical protein